MPEDAVTPGGQTVSCWCLAAGGEESGASASHAEGWRSEAREVRSAAQQKNVGLSEWKSLFARKDLIHSTNRKYRARWVLPKARPKGASEPGKQDCYS